ncbi:MAG: IS110 family transposase [Longimicrobiales bacterium]
MIIVGIDAHSRSHAAAAIDEHGRPLEGIEVSAGARGLAQLSAWIGALPQPRLIAIENARGYGLAVVRLLLAQREELVDVPATLTCDGRRGSGQRGKHDRGDALVIARIGLRDQARLPRLDQSVLDDELKLLADARDQLIVEAGRWRNRAHALLRVAAPGYQAKTGALASPGSVRRARVIARSAARHDPLRGRLTVQALDRLTALERDAGKLEREIRDLLRARRCTHLLAICGVGPIVAAKILGETRGVGRFRNAAAYAAHTGTAPVPASSGRTHRHRLNRGGNRQLNRALYTIAMVQARWDPSARAYLERKLAEGKSAAEARRCLKRHLANVVYRALIADTEAAALT